VKCHRQTWPQCAAVGISIILVLAFGGPLRADQVEMQNGDRLLGTVSSMTAESIVLQSDLLGKIILPRNKVAAITLSPAPAPHAATPPGAPTNNSIPGPRTAPLQSSGDISTALRQLGGDTNLVQQIRQHFLADAGPTANGKFDELLAGLLEGKTDLNALRTEAKSAADQIRSLKKDIGGDASATLDIYLKILDDFLAESAAPSAPATNSAPDAKIIQ
jgi:hypothetical protein